MTPHYTVNSYNELIDVIEELRWESMGNTLVFRGHKDATWEITSTLNRVSGFKTCSDRKLFEQEQIRQFSVNNTEPLCVPPSNENLQAWYHLMQLQHLGCPTRLIDWSSNDFIATYFATEASDKDGAIFTIPGLCNCRSCLNFLFSFDFPQEND